MKQAVITIIRKGLDQFEGQSKGSKGWFKLDSVFFFNILYKSFRILCKTFLMNIDDQYTELYTNFIVPFDEGFIKTNDEKKTWFLNHKHQLS